MDQQLNGDTQQKQQQQRQQQLPPMIKLLLLKPNAKTIGLILVLIHMIWTLGKQQITLSQRYLNEYQYDLNEEQDQQLMIDQLDQEEKEWLGISPDDHEDKEDGEEYGLIPQPPIQREGQERLKYYQLKDLILQMTQVLNAKGRNQTNSLSAYSRATVVRQANSGWFPNKRPPKKQCQETCCVERVAISLGQDERKIINTEDGRDLADLKIQHFASGPRPHLRYFGTQLHPEMLPCLLAGTIVWMENHGKAEKYFWNVLRPQITVPFTLVVSGADGSTPSNVAARFILEDDMLQKFVGTNPVRPNFMKNGTRAYPKYTNEQRRTLSNKYLPMNLGLSRQHAQEKHLLPYLHLTRYTNPFRSTDFAERFNLTRHPLRFHKDVFVHFGLHKPQRQRLWDILCQTHNRNNNETTSSNTKVVDASCNRETKRLSPHTIYTSMSRYRFGISPPGVGYDCYRTYEMLLLGIIPIVEELDPEGYQLLEGLPVIHIPRMTTAINHQQEFVDAIRHHLSSLTETTVRKYETGWEKLFLKHRRRQLLRDTGRDREILVDDEGNEYYQGYRYTIVGNDRVGGDIFCNKAGSCELPSPPPAV